MAFPTSIYVPKTVAPSDARNLSDATHIPLSQHLNQVETDLVGIESILQPPAGFYILEDWIGSGSYGWTSAAAAGGAVASLAQNAASWVVPGNRIQGALSLTTTTTANSSASIGLNSTGIPLGVGAGTTPVIFWVRIGLSDVTTTNSVLVGLIDGTSSTGSSNQIALLWLSGTWVARIRVAGTTSNYALTGFTAPSNFTFTTFVVQIATDLSTVTYSQATNGGTTITPLVTLTNPTNPLPAVQNTQYIPYMLNTAATPTAVSLVSDYFYVYTTIPR